MTENSKRVFPLVIELEDGNASNKLRKFFERTSVEYQMGSNKLWAWRSELRPADIVFGKVV